MVGKNIELADVNARVEELLALDQKEVEEQLVRYPKLARLVAASRNENPFAIQDAYQARKRKGKTGPKKKIHSAAQAASMVYLPTLDVYDSATSTFEAVDAGAERFREEPINLTRYLVGIGLRTVREELAKDEARLEGLKVRDELA